MPLSAFFVLFGKSASAQNSVPVAAFNPFPKDSIFYCGKDSVVLDAGEGYTSYFWNTGETTQKIKTIWTDNYYVQVTNSSGVKSADSVFASITRYTVDAYANQNIPLSTYYDSVVNQTISISLQYPFNRETTLNNSKGSIWVAPEDCLIDSLTFSVASYSPATSEPCLGIINIYEVAGDVFNGIATLKGQYYWKITSTGLVTVPIGLYMAKGKTYRYTFAKGPQSTQSFFGNTANLRSGVIRGFSLLTYTNGTVTDTYAAITNGVWMQLHGKAMSYQINTNSFSSCYNNRVLLNINRLTLSSPYAVGLATPPIVVAPQKDSTIYFEVNDSYQTCKDSVSVKVFNTPFQPFATDSIFACAATQFNLNANTSGFANYEWQPTNSTTPNLLVTTAGWYKVTAAGAQNCKAQDSVYVMLKSSITKEYKFTGNGLYSNANNWDKKNKPPVFVGPYESIIIDPDGTCTMDVPQTISSCSSFIIKKKGKLIIRSSMKIQQ